MLLGVSRGSVTVTMGGVLGCDGGYFGGVEYLGLGNGLRKVIGVVVVF